MSKPTEQCPFGFVGLEGRTTEAMFGCAVSYLQEKRSMTNSLVAKQFESWVDSRCVRRPLAYFRIAFAAIWLFYDLMDMYGHRTATYLWSIGMLYHPDRLLSAQIVLAIAEALLLVGFRPRLFFFVACLARGYEGKIYSLNDFLYYVIVALLLSQCDTENVSKKNPADLYALTWPRDLLILQTAWIYACSAFLKLGPTYLSGGDLYVRQNYNAAALAWYYPSFYLSWISSLPANQFLAWLSVVIEFSLGLFLFLWVIRPKQRKIFRWLSIALAIGVHAMGAIALNVYFFGASLIAQVVLLTWEPVG